MSHYKIIHNPRCSKSRQTLQLLQDNNIEAEVVEYLKNPLSKSDIQQIIELLGVDAHAIVRSKEAEYKEANLSKDAPSDVVLDAMVNFPKLIERPIVIKDGKAAVVGRPPENVLSLISA